MNKISEHVRRTLLRSTTVLIGSYVALLACALAEAEPLEEMRLILLLGLAPAGVPASAVKEVACRSDLVVVGTRLDNVPHVELVVVLEACIGEDHEVLGFPIEVPVLGIAIKS